MEDDCLYKNPKAPIEARVKDLLSRMTLQEKIGQMTQIERSFATPFALSHFSIGSILNSGGSIPFENARSSDWADMIDGFQKSALKSRLGIPIIYGLDAVHGNNNVYGATIFPHNVGLGATRDADIAERIGAATALEVRASGAHYTFAPCVAVCKDPRWGRCYESYGEDTEIVRKMTSIVSGLQGKPPEGHEHGYPFVAGRNNVVACAKHFVGDGGTSKGENEGNTILSYEELERIHMAPYLDCISQGVSTVMASYSSWNGRKLHADRFLLTKILKERLGFKATVGAETEVIYEKVPSKDTINSSEFSFAIVAVGEPPYAESLGDNSELKIPFNGPDIISLVAEQIPTLVILISGRPLLLEPQLLEKIDALVAAWLPVSKVDADKMSIVATLIAR
ncbi:hypothetical protein AHAS_Ahas01G0036900 [Arachis hypogaea]